MRQFLFFFALAFAGLLAFPSNIYSAPPENFQTSLVVGSGLDGPSGFEIAPDGRIFILERTGTIKIYKNGQLLSQPFTVLPSVASGDRGLIGIAFDPEFETNHWVYFYYTALDLKNYLVRFDASQDTTQEVPFIIYQTHFLSEQLHVGGSIRFGADGKLYFAVGDNGYPPNAQDLSNPHGKILRINKDGSIPEDNPFVNQPGKLPEIWAYGFRNPWRFQFDSVTQQIFGGDVGDYTWEEVNHIVKGGNYGWPNAEGICTNCPYINPIHAYNHDEMSSAVTGGPIYRGNMFPPEYQGKLFFSDYARGFIKTIDMEQHVHNDGTTHIHVQAVEDFDPVAGSVVDLKQASDGSIYYLTYYPGRLYRISYATDNHIPVANATSDKTKGLAPLTVQFLSGGSYDPDGNPLTYHWNFGDGTTSTLPNPQKTFTQNGTYTVELTVSDGIYSATAIPIVIQVGTPPTVTIGAPQANAKYNAGDTIFYTASAIDGAGFDLHDGSFTTEVIFHHDTHTHPFLGPIPGNKSGTFTIPTTGEPDPDTWYEIKITVTDTQGLSHTEIVNIYPNLANYTINTEPSGLSISIDGIPYTSPFSWQGPVGYQRELSVPSIQQKGGTTYRFSHWTNSQPQTHIFEIQPGSNNITAVYETDSPFQGEYWNVADGTTNPSIPTTPPDLSRTDASVSFDWGAGSPSSQIDNDFFVARWTKTLELAAGTYRFTTRTDDGVRVYVDNTLILDKWHLQGATMYTTDHTFAAGTHNFRIEYFEYNGDAVAEFNIEQIAGPPPTPTVTPTAPPTDTFTAEFWNTPGAGAQPTIPSRTPDLTRNDQSVNFDWEYESPGTPIEQDNFIARWTKTVNFEPGTYQFEVDADDGVRVFIDNQPIIDQWKDQSLTHYQTEIPVTGGNHQLRIEYYENGGSAVVQFNYQKTHGSTPTPTPTTTPSATPTPPTDYYLAEFWNTPDSSGQPAIPTRAADLQRQDDSIQFNWGQSTPAAPITVDHFVARWSKTAIFETGVYRFTTTADDGVRVYLDDQLILDQWRNQSQTTTVFEVPVTAGEHQIKLEYYEYNWDAIIQFSYQKISSTTPTPTPSPTPSDSYLVEYWNVSAATMPPAIPSTPADATSQDENIASTWDYGSPQPNINIDHFVIRWTKATELTDGIYKFTVTADDGVRVYLDDEIIIDQWKDQSPTAYTVDKLISGGIHTIKIEYYENAWGSVINFDYSKL